ncbi:MAG: 3-mercaptopyruvate sulfurtransferase [Candidatus Rokuibacteriota bacterium]|nr:MAG: 3-mercaptopyruvate sulfurtransferase [Candidatus Rokubacteria bacterium]
MEPTVTTEWLAKHLDEPHVRVVDGTWHMPQAKRDARAEFEAAHIPGAVFFDIDAIADRATSLPHMLPSAAQFAASVGELGISNGHRIVVYDVRGVVSAARVWWTFRAFGHDDVAVLDGGLRKWRAEGRPVESGGAAPARGAFTARLRPELVRDVEAMRANVARRTVQVLDARSAGRFAGTEPEPRAGLRGGHIPGSLSLPYETLYRPDGTLKPPNELREAVTAAGVDLGRPVVTTCGSGVTASVLALALYLIGRRDVAVYDGSWSEWGSRSDTPVET